MRCKKSLPDMVKKGGAIQNNPTVKRYGRHSFHKKRSKIVNTNVYDDRATTPHVSRIRHLYHKKRAKSLSTNVYGYRSTTTHVAIIIPNAPEIINLVHV